ncbi:MAG: hypothetical protein E6R13_09740 [Spirochaetes bacterium]|nr:MAG: hypothetical protein E6R13_09740 [Spirochaetota bacterium]
MNTNLRTIPTNGSHTTSFGYRREIFPGANPMGANASATTIAPVVTTHAVITPVGTTNGKTYKVFLKPYTAITRLFAKSHYSFNLVQMPKTSVNVSTYRTPSSPRPYIASAVRIDGTNASFTTLGNFEPVLGNIIEIYDCGCTGKSVQDRYEFAEIVKFEEI